MKRKFNFNWISVICWSIVLVINIIKCRNGEPASYVTTICALACLVLLGIGDILVKKLDEKIAEMGEDEDEAIYR